MKKPEHAINWKETFETRLRNACFENEVAREIRTLSSWTKTKPQRATVLRGGRARAWEKDDNIKRYKFKQKTVLNPMDEISTLTHAN